MQAFPPAAPVVLVRTGPPRLRPRLAPARLPFVLIFRAVAIEFRGHAATARLWQKEPLENLVSPASQRPVIWPSPRRPDDVSLIS
jgi:hypothetical protein